MQSKLGLKTLLIDCLSFSYYNPLREDSVHKEAISLGSQADDLKAGHYCIESLEIGFHRSDGVFI